MKYGDTTGPKSSALVVALETTTSCCRGDCEAKGGASNSLGGVKDGEITVGSVLMLNEAPLVDCTVAARGYVRDIDAPMLELAVERALNERDTLKERRRLNSIEGVTANVTLALSVRAWLEDCVEVAGIESLGVCT
jgi:hypothetical protein